MLEKRAKSLNKPVLAVATGMLGCFCDFRFIIELFRSLELSKSLSGVLVELTG